MFTSGHKLTEQMSMIKTDRHTSQLECLFRSIYITITHHEWFICWQRNALHLEMAIFKQDIQPIYSLYELSHLLASELFIVLLRVFVALASCFFLAE